MKQKNYQHEPLRIPQGWIDQARALVVQIERILDDIYNKLGKSKETTDRLEKRKTEFVHLDAAVLTDPTAYSWDNIWEELNSIKSGEIMNVVIEATPCSLLTGGVRSNKMYGFIGRRSDNIFSICAKLNTNELILGTITGATETFHGTYTEINITEDYNDKLADKANGKRQTKSIPANTNQCVIDFPAGEFLLNLSLPGLSRTWYGLVYVNTAGEVSLEKLTTKTGITLTEGTYSVTATFSYTSDTTLHMFAIPLRSNTYPSFH